MREVKIEARDQVESSGRSWWHTRFCAKNQMSALMAPNLFVSFSPLPAKAVKAEWSPVASGWLTEAVLSRNLRWQSFSLLKSL